MVATLANAAADSGSSWSDSEGDAFVYPNTSGAILGLPCPSIDFLQADITSYTLEARFVDLAVDCVGEDPVYQTYSYEATISGGGWDEIRVEVTRESATEAFFAVQTYSNWDPLEVYEIGGAIDVDYLGSILTVNLEMMEVDSPIGNAVFESRLDSCVGGRCIGSLGRAYADRMPDQGLTTILP